MTSEIEKMYENAGIKMQHLLDVNTNQFVDVYPQFTAEKQLEIVKFMFHKGIYYDTDGDTYWFHYTDDIENATYRPFKEAIAEFINCFWQDLADAEKAQIRDILK